MPSKNTLCVISARGGSRGLPGKNYMKIMGKPLITHAIEKAFASKGPYPTRRAAVYVLCAYNE